MSNPVIVPQTMRSAGNIEIHRGYNKHTITVFICMCYVVHHVAIIAARYLTDAVHYIHNIIERWDCMTHDGV